MQQARCVVALAHAVRLGREMRSAGLARRLALIQMNLVLEIPSRREKQLKLEVSVETGVAGPMAHWPTLTSVRLQANGQHLAKKT
jgi:hypothetical protein